MPYVECSLSQQLSGESMAKVLGWLAMAARTCLVTVTDLRGIRQSVEVTAETVFEAAARALSALRQDPWIDAIGPATRLDIQVPQPAITHTVTVQQLERWANGSAVNPDERIRKDQLKAILAGTGE
jgi:hypothetical protein